MGQVGNLPSVQIDNTTICATCETSHDDSR